MYKRKVAGNLTEKRMLDTKEACSYVGIGQSAIRPWLDEIGATRKFGRSVRFDKNVIDAALDSMSEREGKE